jgi:hypothetical protein
MAVRASEMKLELFREQEENVNLVVSPGGGDTFLTELSKAG